VNNAGALATARFFYSIETGRRAAFFNVSLAYAQRSHAFRD